MASYTGPAQLSVAAVLQATESWAEPENEASLDRSRRSAQSCERHDTLDCCSWKTVKMGIKCYFCDFVSIYWLLPLNWYSTDLHTCIWVNTALIFFSILQLKGQILIKCTYSWSEYLTIKPDSDLLSNGLLAQSPYICVPQTIDDNYRCMSCAWTTSTCTADLVLQLGTTAASIR